MTIKVCGMRDAANIAEVARSGPDMMGFIFHEPSPRNACSMPSGTLDALPPDIKRVGVFVDATREAILATVRRYGLDFVQLHGGETPEMCVGLRGEGLGVIKAFGIASCEDIGRAIAYEGTCDYYVFDTRIPDAAPGSAHGGSGRQFDHGLLRFYDGATPFLLSGGLGPGDAPTLARLAVPMLAGFDVNSRFETAPGIKNPNAIEEFISSLRGGETDEAIQRSDSGLLRPFGLAMTTGIKNHKLLQ